MSPRALSPTYIAAELAPRKGVDGESAGLLMRPTGGNDFRLIEKRVHLDLVAGEPLFESFTACSISATVKLEIPMLRASPVRLTSHNAAIVSLSETCGFGQCSKSRSTSERRSRVTLSLAERSRSRALKWEGHTLVVMKISSRPSPLDRKSVV